MSLVSQVQQLMLQEGASDCVVVESQPLRVRKDGQWMEIESRFFEEKALDEFVHHSLDEQDRQFLVKNRWVQASLGEDSEWRFRVSVQGGMFSVCVSYAPLDLSGFEPIRTIQDVSPVPNGMVVLCGPGRSGRTTLLRQFLNERRKVNAEPFLIVGDSEEFAHADMKSMFVQRGLDVDQAALTTFLNSHTHVGTFAFDFNGEGQFDLALSASKQGAVSVVTQPTMNVVTCLQDIASRCSEAEWSTFVGHFRAVISQKLVPGREGGMFAANEVLLPSTDVGAALNRKDWWRAVQLMHGSGEASGMRTLNQSLLQLLLRRKVELKQAFMHSDNPDELDRMLSKAGI